MNAECRTKRSRVVVLNSDFCTLVQTGRHIMLRNRSSRVESLERRTLFNAVGWVDTIDNPFMPMVAGMTWLYKGTKDGEAMKDRVIVQSYTKKIAEVTCTVVLDRSY